MPTDISNDVKLELFRELASCGTNIYQWQYAADGHLYYTNSPHLVLDRFFENAGCKSYMLEGNNQYTAPLILSGPMGLMWSAVFHYVDGKPDSFYVLGPVFDSEVSNKNIEEFARQSNVNLPWRETFIRLLEGLPILSPVLFFQYTLMLHYCVNNEKLERSSLHFQKNEHPDDPKHSAPTQRGRMGTWNAERELLRMVSEGNMNYQKAFRRAGLLSNGVRSGGKNPTLQALISATTFTALCTREAIESGISPETAYSVGDSYIQSLVAAKTTSEIAALNHAMYEDFIQRVHKHRSNPKVSPPIQSCIDFIDLHSDEPLPLKLLAERIGYSEYHLSRKFHQEMGMTIKHYIHHARIEQAKHDLIYTSDPIAEIAERFQFSSSSHFSSVFQELEGIKPQEYRNAHKMV